VLAPARMRAEPITASNPIQIASGSRPSSSSPP
jgi:hypothetical protein